MTIAAYFLLPIYTSSEKRQQISDCIKGPLVAVFRSPLMKALDRSVETLGLWIVTSSVTFIKSANQSSVKLCLIRQIYYTHFEITGGPCNLIGSNWINLLTNRTIFFPANEEASLKTKQPIRFQGLFKVTDQIAGKWKTKSIMWQILQLLFPKLLAFPPQKWMNLISDRFSTTSIK